MSWNAKESKSKPNIGAMWIFFCNFAFGIYRRGKRGDMQNIKLRYGQEKISVCGAGGSPLSSA